jgi:hypothetical protein
VRVVNSLKPINHKIDGRIDPDRRCAVEKKTTLRVWLNKRGLRKALVCWRASSHCERYREARNDGRKIPFKDSENSG